MDIGHFVETNLFFFPSFYPTKKKVGLAAGDIEAVRKNAYLRILRAQVHILKTIELSYPKSFLSRFYREKCDEYPDLKLSRFDQYVTHVFYFLSFCCCFFVLNCNPYFISCVLTYQFALLLYTRWRTYQG